MEEDAEDFGELTWPMGLAGDNCVDREWMKGQRESKISPQDHKPKNKPPLRTD